jgi:hypothetical protein
MSKSLLPRDELVQALEKICEIGMFASYGSRLEDATKIAKDALEKTKGDVNGND